MIRESQRKCFKTLSLIISVRTSNDMLFGWAWCIGYCDIKAHCISCYIMITLLCKSTWILKVVSNNARVQCCVYESGLDIVSLQFDKLKLENRATLFNETVR